MVGSTGPRTEVTSKDVLLHVIRNVLGMGEGCALEQICEIEECYKLTTLMMVSEEVLCGTYVGSNGHQLKLKTFEAFQVSNLRLFSRWHRINGTPISDTGWLAVTKDEFDEFMRTEVHSHPMYFPDQPRRDDPVNKAYQGTTETLNQATELK